MRMNGLRKLRLERNLTMQALAEAAGIHQRTIAAHEYGVANDVHYSIAASLAVALGVPVESLFLAEANGQRMNDEAEAAA